MDEFRSAGDGRCRRDGFLARTRGGRRVDAGHKGGLLVCRVPPRRSAPCHSRWRGRQDEEALGVRVVPECAAPRQAEMPSVRRAASHTRARSLPSALRTYLSACLRLMASRARAPHARRHLCRPLSEQAMPSGASLVAVDTARSRGGVGQGNGNVSSSPRGQAVLRNSAISAVATCYMRSTRPLAGAAVLLLPTTSAPPRDGSPLPSTIVDSLSRSERPASLPFHITCSVCARERRGGGDPPAATTTTTTTASRALQAATCDHIGASDCGSRSAGLLSLVTPLPLRSFCGQVERHKS